MDSLSNWAWWMIAGGILLSPVFAFLLAVVVEILLGVLTQLGMPALVVIVVAVACARYLRNSKRARPPAGDLLGDQA